MSESLLEISQLLRDDPWRESVPFSPELHEYSQPLLEAGTDAQREAALKNWLSSKHQPCLFGRMAAKGGAVRYCFLTEDDLAEGDRHVKLRIAQARREWQEAARTGNQHAFVIHLVSERIMLAAPNHVLLSLATRLGSLYLNREVETDKIEHDRLFLEYGEEIRRWYVGVNYFSSQGDGRWWHDHRIPAGMAFSMNSVGHMATARRCGQKFPGDDESQHLQWALGTAMHLLEKTVPARSGRCTWLTAVADVPESVPRPYKEGDPYFASVSDKNYCAYGGLYHTDHSIPTPYFAPVPDRPQAPAFTDLDLTYLHLDTTDNPDYLLQGRGVRVDGGQNE